MNFFNKVEAQGFFYNENQKKAITHIDGPLLVAAGPGSGKTSVITARTAYLVQNNFSNNSSILVITFTRAAANEMKTRFIGFPNITEQNLKKVDFGTFHSTFYKIINSYYGRHIPVLEESKAFTIIKSILKSINEPYDDDIIKRTLNEISIAHTLFEKPEDFVSEHYSCEKFLSIHSHYEKQKKAIKCIDFDDMMIICKNILETDKSALNYYRQKYNYFLIDEFQDTCKLQFDIVKLLSSPIDNICVVGDDDQSIYGFRGVLPNCFTRFENSFKSCKSVILNINYRSTCEIVKISKMIISNNTLRKEKDLKSTGIDGERAEMIFPADEENEACVIVDSIEKMHEQGRTFSNLAVLYRVNMQARPVIDELIRRNIPFNVRDGLNNFFEHWVCRDITSYLKLTVNSNDMISLVKIINRPARYIHKNNIEKAISNYKPDITCAAKAFENSGLKDFQKENIDKLFYSLRTLKYMPPSSAVHFIRKSIAYDEHIKNYCAESNIIQEELFNILDEYEMSSSRFKTISEFLSHIYEVSLKIKQNKSNFEYKRDSVTLSTIHSSKGLEFCCTYIIGTIEGYIPHTKSLSTKEAIEEERRLLYVAVTRAKEKLVISSPKKYHGKTALISRFINEISKIDIPLPKIN